MTSAYHFSVDPETIETDPVLRNVIAASTKFLLEQERLVARVGHSIILDMPSRPEHQKEHVYRVEFREILDSGRALAIFCRALERSREGFLGPSH